ncbi:hypothetical protein L7G72_00690 [Xenorhabdus bovienii]|uniref:hypothetical protein n=1 Tax=Xenorhabdus bovienii TaxID=40576 RepID=UPI001EDD5EA4|nr:hypothetical protein [Xenorhabdus bovienii]MCG3460397.1 hypothetical protein [Xenorhabdus bovienii]
MNIKEINIYLSKLISNPKYSIKMYENPNKFMEIYHISQSSRGILIDFFRRNGSKFVNSSILQKTKRMDGLIMSLPNLYNYLNKDNFELEFEKYLINIDFNNEVKKNPIIESTFFCEHIIQKTGDDLLRTIALYEKEKNNLLIDLQEKTFNIEVELSKDIKYDAIEKIFIVSNPTIRIKEFDTNIKSLLSLIEKENFREELNKKMEKVKTNIVFYRRDRTRKITSLSIGNIINYIILTCKTPISACKLFEKINKQYILDRESFSKTLKILSSKNLISLSNKGDNI